MPTAATPDYSDVATAAAMHAGLTAAAVAAMRYRAIAALAGVKVGADGSSPDDFFWHGVRHAAVNALRQNRRAARRARLRDEVADLFGGGSNDLRAAKLTWSDHRRLVIDVGD